jgi:hypothetical protein
VPGEFIVSDHNWQKKRRLLPDMMRAARFNLEEERAVHLIRWPMAVSGHYTMLSSLIAAVSSDLYDGGNADSMFHVYAVKSSSLAEVR